MKRGQAFTESPTDKPADGSVPLMPAWRVRLSGRHQALIQAHVAEHGLSQVESLRALLERGHQLRDDPLGDQPLAHVHARLTELGGAMEALSASLSELHDAVQEIATVLATLSTTYGKVWVESLMANRLLLDAHHRGLVERARHDEPLSRTRQQCVRRGGGTILSSRRDSSVGDFTRGGQVLIHFLRMTGQVLRKSDAALLIPNSLLTISLWFAQTDAYARYLGARNVGTSLGMMLGNGANEFSVELRAGRLA